MKLTKNQTAKIIILLVIIMIFNIIFPVHSNAGFIAGILTKPICFFIVSAVDGINVILNSIFVPADAGWKDFQEAVDNADDGGVINKILQGKYSTLMSPDKIFKGEVELLNANIFKAPVYNGNFGKLFGAVNGTSIASALKVAVSSVYIILRNIAAIILLCLLIYTGIRILLKSASPYDQAKWKQALIDWIKALCLLMFMHFIMIGIFYISDLIVDSLKGAMYNNLPIVVMIRNAFANSTIWNGSESVITTIMYIYITYLTIVFIIAYFKRLAWIVILIIISPIVAVTKALGTTQTKIFERWFREYTYTVLLQPFHMLIFFVLVAIPLGMMDNSVDSVSFLEMFKFEAANYGIYFYILVALSMIRPAEKFLYSLFGFNNSAIAKQGSSESGVKTLKAVEKVVKDTAGLAAGIVTGGVAAGAGVSSKFGASGALGGGPGGLPGGGPGRLPVNPSGDPGIDSGDLPDSDLNRLPGDEPNEFQHDSQSELPEDSLDNGYKNELGDGVNKENEELDSQNQFRSINGANIENAYILGSIGNLENLNRLDGLNSLDVNKDNENKVLDKDSGANNKTLDNNKIEMKDAEFDVPNAEFDETIGANKQNKQKNKLMDRLEKNHPYIMGGLNYLKTKEGKENINNLRGGLHELRDTMYLDGEGGGAPGEWKNGAFGYDNMNKKLEEGKKAEIKAFVNNPNNINYMKQEHNLTEKEAKARLEEGAPFINRGITNVAAVDKLISESKLGESADSTIRNAAKTIRSEEKVENVINDQSKVQAVAQIIASRTKESPKAEKVQQQAKDTMQQARPYIEAGQKDPEVLHRLVQLENRLKNSRAAKTTRTPDKVMRMDRIINKAMKDGLKEINITSDNSSSDMKKLEGVMNKELKQRLEITDGKDNKTNQ